MLDMGPSRNILGILFLIRKRMQGQFIHGKLANVCCQRIYGYFFCGESMFEVLGHASKSLNCVSKLKTHG
jgi:hypothetical protein